MSDTPGMATVVSDGFSVTTNKGTAAELEANLKSEPAPAEGEPESPKEAEERETKAAAAKLGKKGGEAAARAKANKEPDDLESDDEAKPKEPEQKPEPQKPESDEADTEKPGNPRHDAKARIAQLAREKNEAKARADALEREVAELKAAKDKPQKTAAEAPDAKPATAAAADDPEPSPDTFESYEGYVKAQARWEVRQELKEERRKQEENQRIEKAVEHVKKRGDTFRDRVFAAQDADPAIKERLSSPESVELQKRLAPSWSLPPGTKMQAINDISDAIIDSEQAPELLLYLSENPDELDRLERLPDPGAVMRAMGKLEAQVSREAAPTPAPVMKPAPAAYSQAKPPIKPVAGAPAAGEDDPDAEDDFDAYKRKADARDSRIRRRA